MSMANQERIIENWIYPMDSSCTPYNETDFKNQVIEHCRSEFELLNECKDGNTLDSIKNRLRIAKCNVIGDPSVGKTCLVNRFGYDVFDCNSKATIGVDFDVQKFSILNRPFTLQIWDTAGDERFRSITRAYYRGAHAALIVFDLSLIKSFQNVQHWYDEMMEAMDTTDKEQQQIHTQSNTSNRPFLFLVGTKKDLVTEETINFYRKEAAKLADKIGAEFWMVSSSTGENVSDLFKRVACLTFDRYIMKELQSTLSFKQDSNSPDPPDRKNRKRSAKYSAENGGQVLFYEEDQEDPKPQKRVVRKESNNNDNDGINCMEPFHWISQLWSYYFGKHGKLRKRLSTKGKVADSEQNNGLETMDKTQTTNDKKKRNKTFQCFRLTCMVGID